MNVHAAPDNFEVVNGPEDGTQFPVLRTPMDIGGEPACGIFLRLDPQVRGACARVSAASEGYRIRALGRCPVLVDGLPAGRIRSRIVRQGGIVQAGGTELMLAASPGGLASRSRGLPTENDASWVLRLAWPRFKGLLGLFVRIVAALPGFVLRHWFLLLALAAAAVAIHPQLRHDALAWFHRNFG